jgi:hypothetical protein
MNANSNLNETAEAWAKITVERFIKSIDKRKIGKYDPSKKSATEKAKYGNLRDSFVHEVIHAANGDAQKIKLSFMYWGAMVDMGVAGRRGPRGTKRRIDRRPKKWYSKTAEHEVFKLGRILAEKYGFKSVNVILQELPLEVQVNL